MVTVTDQDIPGALVALFGTYAAKAKATQGANGALRARRRVKKRPYKKRPNKYHAALWPLCVEAATNYAARYTGTAVDPLALRIFAQAKRGTFPDKWWTRLIHATTTYHSSAPTSVERTSPNPYAYRDPNNRPTIPTYPSASAGAAPARYAGSTASQLYRDTLLVFRRDTFKADPPAPLTDATRIIYQATGNTTAAASTRAARPLMGLTCAAAVGAQSVAPITNTTPPLGKGNAIYPRYKNKKTPAPYYSASAAYDLTRLINPARATVPPATFERATIDLAPLPAMGYRYNNNTSISTSTALSATPAAIIPVQPLPAAPMVTDAATATRIISPYTGEQIGTLLDIAQYDQHSAGLYFYTMRPDNWIESRKMDGELLATICAFEPGAGTYVVPYAWDDGWITINYFTAETPQRISYKKYTWAGKLVFEANLLDEEWQFFIWNAWRLLRTPGLGQAGVGSPDTLYNYEQITSTWVVSGLPILSVGAASVDGLHYFSPAGDYYFAPYPDPAPAVPGYQPPITPAIVTNIGYKPTTVHRAHAGVLTYHASVGFRMYYSDGSYTQLAATTAYQPLSHYSGNYKIT